MSRVAAVVGLALVYALTLASFHPLDLLLGILLGAAVIAWGRRTFRLDGSWGSWRAMSRLASLPGLAAAVVAKTVAGTWQVALAVTGLRPLEHPGMVAVPIGERTETGVVVTALALTLSPGEVLVDVDRDRGVMLIHTIDASDPDAVREDHARFYERQRRVFP